MKEQIKELRVKIDGLSQLVKDLKPINSETATFKNDIAQIQYGRNNLKYVENAIIIVLDKKNSKELNKAYDSLILAKAWLGKILQELGEETPYKNDGNRKTVEDIESAADINKQDVEAVLRGSWKNETHIEKVDWLRQEIKDIISNINIDWGVENGNMNELHFDNVYTHLSEARFWLGFELGRVRDNK